MHQGILRGSANKGDKVGQMPLDPCAAGLIDQTQVLIEFLLDAGNHHLVAHMDARQGGVEHQLQVRLGPGAAHRAVGLGDKGYRLVLQRRLERRARGPVDGVLQHRRDAVVVLRAADDQSVGGADLLQEVQHHLRALLAGQIFAVERQLQQVGADVLMLGQLLGDKAQQCLGVTSAVEAAREQKNVHGDAHQDEIEPKHHRQGDVPVNGCGVSVPL